MTTVSTHTLVLDDDEIAAVNVALAILGRQKRAGNPFTGVDVDEKTIRNASRLSAHITANL